MNTFFAVIIVIFILLFIIATIKSLCVGSIYFYNMAYKGGFIGIAAYLACWFFMTPIMICVCIFAGAFGDSKKMNKKQQASSLNTP